MLIKKRNGNLDKLDINQIYKQLVPATDGTRLTPDDIALSARISFKDGMLSTELQQLLIRASLDLVEVDNIDGDKVAARLYLYDMYHTVKRNYFEDKVEGDVYKAITFGDYYNFNKNLLTYDISKFDIIALNTSIKPENDLLFTYLGITTLKERYLLTSLGKLRELPQHALMSLACFLAQNEKDPTFWALEFYSIMTELEYLPGTPTLNNGRKLNGNCYSCAVGSAPDDIVGIFDVYKIIALGSKYGSGWGFDWSKIRANGSIIQDKLAAAGGLIPFLKIVNDISISVNQLGYKVLNKAC